MSSRKRAAADDYESDNGFVEKDEDSKGKKAKTQHNSGPKSDVVGGGSRNDEGEEYWEISSTRRVVVGEFKGKKMISIREFYEKDGKSLPGKKGITLPLEQFANLVKLLPHVEAVLKDKGEELPRPEYDAEQMPDAGADGDGPKNEDEAEEHKKKNFEETSEEE